MFIIIIIIWWLLNSIGFVVGLTKYKSFGEIFDCCYIDGYFNLFFDKVLLLVKFVLKKVRLINGEMIVNVGNIIINQTIENVFNKVLLLLKNAIV
jgi:hypothetical protein